MNISKLAFAAFLAFASPAGAQECTTLDAALAQMKGKVADDKITVTDDVGFIAAYHKAMGLTIPDGSQPVKFIMVAVPPIAIIGIVEPNGCILHHARVPFEKHLGAVQSAASGV